MEHQKFRYASLEAVREELARLGVSFPLKEDVSCLGEPVKIRGFTAASRLGTAPMEGNDSEEDGGPSQATVNRYVRLARGGAALIWMEAVAVVPEGRSSRRQLVLNRKTLPAFQRMIDKMKGEGRRKNGFAPVIIMQANHSGRYSKPQGVPAPMIAYHHPVYEREERIGDSRIVSDGYLEGLEEAFGRAAYLCREAGFDGIDVKSCHGYLFAELASAYTRPGRYGGCFENRFRLLKNSMHNAKEAEREDFLVTARIGIYDGFPYPYGFGVEEGGGIKPDYTEPVRLIGELRRELSLSLVNITMGNPYVDTHVTRPFDMGKYIPPEHPFEGVARMYEGAGAIKRAFPGLVTAASAPSYLRQFSPALAAGAVDQGICDMILFGRESFACPEFAEEVIHTGGLAKNHTCVACGKCGDLIRAGLPTGCVVRDPDHYLPYYRQLTGG